MDLSIFLLLFVVCLYLYSNWGSIVCLYLYSNWGSIVCLYLYSNWGSNYQEGELDTITLFNPSIFVCQRLNFHECFLWSFSCSIILDEK